MNHPFVVEQAKLAARRTLAFRDRDDAARIEEAYRVTLGRAPTTRERELAQRYVVADGGAGAEAWAQLYQALFACVDFRYLN
jgi:hypothetical protein